MTKVKHCFYCCCIVGLFCASAMAQDAEFPSFEFYFSEDGNEPGVGGDLTVNVLPGGGTVCVDLYARSLFGEGCGSLGTEVAFNETANFSGGGTLDADCATAAIDLGHAFICNPNRWSTRLVNPGPSDCTAGPVHFVHAAGGPPPNTCVVPDGSGLYIAELCYDYSADAWGTATISNTSIVILDCIGCCFGPFPHCTFFRTLTIRVVDCLEDADCCVPDCNDNGVFDLCDIADGTSEDCTGNNIPDECEIDPDCNANGLSDSNDICNGFSIDCNTNAIPDECDIAAGTSQDTFPTRFGGDGVPDECQTREATPAGL